MNNGIPDCPDCGGKGMCDKHKLEYLYYEYDKTRNVLRAEMAKQKEKLIESIKNLKTERNKNEKL